MKTILKRFVFALAALVTIVPISCNKDEKSSDIEGTTWTVSYVDTEDGETWEMGESFTFLAGGRGTYTYFQKRLDVQENYSYTAKGTYVYNAPNVIFTLEPDEDGDVYFYTGVINGNKMAVYDWDGDFLDTFTKQ